MLKYFYFSASMRNAFLFISLFCVFCSTDKVRAQSDSLSQYPKNVFSIEPIFNIGSAIKNTPSFPPIGLAYISELSFAWQTMGRKDWNHYYKFPTLGFSFVYGIFGNDQVIGRNYALMPHFALDMARNFEMRIGCGLAYFPVKNDPITNPDNYLIGSHLSTCVSMSMTWRKKLSKHFVLQLGGASFHSSNGHYQLPNVGLNSLVVTAGLKYFPSEVPVKTVKKDFAKIKYPLRFNVRLGLGAHEFGNEKGPIGGPKYAIYSSSLYLSKRYGGISNVHAGITGRYYSNYYSYISDSSLYSSGKQIRSCAFSAFLGYEFMCGHYSLLAQGAINIYNPFYKYYHAVPKQDFFEFGETWNHNRLGVQYYLFEPSAQNHFNMFAGIYINANLGRADFTDVSLGFVF